MKTFQLSVLSFLILIAGHTTVIAQSADEVVNKHIAAIGGEENWKKINSMKLTGSINANGTQITMAQTVVNGKAVRQDITLMGMSGYSIATNKEGWVFMPFQGQTKPEAMTADQVKDAQDEMDLQGKLIDYQKKGSSIVYLGKDDVEGTECYKIKLTLKNSKEETMYFDASNYYLVKTVDKIKMDNKEQEVTVMYSNYQKQPEGIVIPMSVNAQGGEVAFKTVEINKPIDESIFKPGK